MAIFKKDLSAINKKYSIILADPPWLYTDKLSMKGGGGCEKHYSTMSVNDIKKLSINNISNDNCQLYMWVTNPFLVSGEATEVVKAWGFKPKQLLTWGKTYKDGSLEMGMGYYYRSSTEHIIFAVKGKVKLLNKSTKNLHLVHNPKKHSRKPNYFRNLIVNTAGDLPRIELFARQSVKGWDSWGLEVDKYK